MNLSDGDLVSRIIVGDEGALGHLEYRRAVSITIKDRIHFSSHNVPYVTSLLVGDEYGTKRYSTRVSGRKSTEDDAGFLAAIGRLLNSKDFYNGTMYLYLEALCPSGELTHVNGALYKSKTKARLTLVRNR